MLAKGTDTTNELTTGGGTEGAEGCGGWDVGVAACAVVVVVVADCCWTTTLGCCVGSADIIDSEAGTMAAADDGCVVEAPPAREAGGFRVEIEVSATTGWLIIIDCVVSIFSCEQTDITLHIFDRLNQDHLITFLALSPSTTGGVLRLSPDVTGDEDVVTDSVATDGDTLTGVGVREFVFLFFEYLPLDSLSPSSDRCFSTVSPSSDLAPRGLELTLFDLSDELLPLLWTVFCCDEDDEDEDEDVGFVLELVDLLLDELLPLVLLLRLLTGGEAFVVDEVDDDLDGCCCGCCVESVSFSELESELWFSADTGLYGGIVFTLPPFFWRQITPFLV